MSKQCMEAGTIKKIVIGFTIRTATLMPVVITIMTIIIIIVVVTIIVRMVITI